MTTSLNALVTCVAGDGDPYVKVQFKDLADAQRFHASLATIAKPVGCIDKWRQKYCDAEIYDIDSLMQKGWTPVYAAALSERDAPQAQAVKALEWADYRSHWTANCEVGQYQGRLPI